MRKVIGPVLTLLTLTITTLLISGNHANATAPPSNCQNVASIFGFRIACEMDINDDGILNGMDLKIIIRYGPATLDQLYQLTLGLDELDIDNPPTSAQFDQILAVIRSVLGDDASHAVIVLPCGCQQ